MTAANRLLLGRISALWRYPVKSMAGESLSSCPLGATGLPDDRRYAFIKSADTSNFPWLTARDYQALLLYRPRITGRKEDGLPLIQVQTPGGEDLPLDSPELLEEIRTRSRQTCTLRQDPGGIFDSHPVSVISAATVRSAGAAIGKSLDIRRFRPNIVVEPTRSDELPETEWIGCTLIFGAPETGVRVCVEEGDPRCMMINLDPDTVEQDGRVLTQVVRDYQGCAGVYGRAIQAGSVHVGDEVWLES